MRNTIKSLSVFIILLIFGACSIQTSSEQTPMPPTIPQPPLDLAISDALSQLTGSTNGLTAYTIREEGTEVSDTENYKSNYIEQLFIGNNTYKAIRVTLYDGTVNSGGNPVQYSNEVVSQLAEEGTSTTIVNFILQNSSDTRIPTDGYDTLYTHIQTRNIRFSSAKSGGSGKWEVVSNLVPPAAPSLSTNFFILKNFSDRVSIIPVTPEQQSDRSTNYAILFSTLTEAEKRAIIYKK